MLNVTEMGRVYCGARAECLNIIQVSDNFAYYQGFRKHLTIIKDYWLTYMWYQTFDIKEIDLFARIGMF